MKAGTGTSLPETPDMAHESGDVERRWRDAGCPTLATLLDEAEQAKHMRTMLRHVASECRRHRSGDTFARSIASMADRAADWRPGS